jgi:two-component system LytT family response regulator
MNLLKSIIVDDVKLVRKELKLLLKDYPEIKVVGEASNVNQAVRLSRKLKPDVIFLDIQLHGELGFDLLDRENITSKVIFITAYDQYAIRAFEVNALDYLLKPVTRERLSQAIRKLFQDEPKSRGPVDKIDYNDIIYLVINGSLKFIKVSLLKYIIAEGKYSYIVYEDKKKDLISKTLQEWENILPGKYFIRIHRSTIINLEYVESVTTDKNQTHKIFIKNIDKPFIISRRCFVRLKNIFNQL